MLTMSVFRLKWPEQIDELIELGYDQTSDSDAMQAAEADGLDELPWDGPKYEDWLKGQYSMTQSTYRRPQAER